MRLKIIVSLVALNIISQPGYEPTPLISFKMAGVEGFDVEAGMGGDASVSNSTAFTLEQFTRLWMMGLSAERTLGKPKDWSGDDAHFESFVYKYSAWLAGLPGDAEHFLEAAAQNGTPIITANLSPEHAVMAKGIHQSLCSLVDGKALNIVKSVRDNNGFEVWRRMYAEYRPNIAGSKISLLEAVMNATIKQGDDFSTWYRGWLEDIRLAE